MGGGLVDGRLGPGWVTWCLVPGYQGAWNLVPGAWSLEP
jgi:hypothetical protein